jgi:hypothetical protein
LIFSGSVIEILLRRTRQCQAGSSLSFIREIDELAGKNMRPARDKAAPLAFLFQSKTATLADYCMDSTGRQAIGAPELT